jgi:hypothetical protein
VIHARDVLGLGLMLEDIRDKEVFPTVVAAAEEFCFKAPAMSQAVRDIQNAFPGSQVMYGQGGQQLPQQFQPGGNAPNCAHGAMQYVAQGKYGPFWACPQPRGAYDKCKAVNAR